MRKLIAITVAGLALLVPFFIWIRSAQQPTRVEPHETAGPVVQLAALGRVEGRSETISVGAATDGVVKAVFADEGQQVSKGALLAVINCDDISAQVDLAKAQADSARQARIRLLRGNREEERAAAAQATDAAKAVMLQAQDHLKRMDALYQKSEISRDMFDQAKRDFDVAQANFQRAQDEQNLTDAQPLPEDVSRADAEVTAAERNVAVTMDRLEKCNVRAPISGTVLKVLTKAGESYSTLVPQPLFTIADESVRRVRAEVDERDIGRVKLGQQATVTADAYPGKKFEGQVVEISQAMQSKSVLGEDPSQKTDRDVLDVVVQLKPSKEQLPLGLRVTAEMTGTVTPIPQPASTASAAASVTYSAPNSDVTDSPAVQKAAVDPAGTTTKHAQFLLQAGAMTHTENADALATLLKKKSFPAFVIARNGDPFYRVDVGPYPDLASANAAKQELSTSGFETIIKHQGLSPAR
ncbi:MAG TPA: efflux RND transporter periplasmic adaptor subunit [Candidatus Acidoferrales bacterium]|nr:efflux RND transporter periplasmic adaptor subunit [Candidatus Acidoferrales bacterium]